MSDLTANIDRTEMACACGCGFDIADIELLTVVQDSANFFMHRDKASKVRILMKSGCRCPRHNEEEGGAPNSYHLYAKAIDYIVQIWNDEQWITIPAVELASYLDGKYPHKYGIIIYWSGRVHFDIRQVRYRKRV